MTGLERISELLRVYTTAVYTVLPLSLVDSFRFTFTHDGRDDVILMGILFGLSQFLVKTKTIYNP